MSASLSWVDAFSEVPFAGNPAGVCLLDAPMTDDHMQSLAAELGIAETAFLTPVSEPGSYALRWFSPATEIDLCGHATMASAHVLRERGVVDGTGAVTFHTRSGPLVASFAGDRISLDFPSVPMTPAPLPAPLAGQWGSAVVASGSAEFFSFVVLDNEAAVRGYRPDLAAIAAVDRRAVLITAEAEADADADYVLRVFGPNVGIDEDPATGSAQCTAGPYWSSALGRSELVARQLSPRGALFHVRPEGERVHIAGHAVTVMQGHLC